MLCATNRQSASKGTTSMPNCASRWSNAHCSSTKHRNYGKEPGMKTGEYHYRHKGLRLVAQIALLIKFRSPCFQREASIRTWLMRKSSKHYDHQYRVKEYARIGNIQPGRLSRSLLPCAGLSRPRNVRCWLSRRSVQKLNANLCDYPTKSDKKHTSSQRLHGTTVL